MKSRSAVIFCLCAALALSTPMLARAQYSDTDQQNPKEYTQEDSHPLRIIAYILSPIGFVLEWTIARPLHWIATNPYTPPVFGAATTEPNWTPPPIAEIPLDNVGHQPGTAHTAAAAAERLATQPAALAASSDQS
jgi:hypothetical protein